MADTFNKRLDVSDVFTLPYEANKSWSVTSESFSSSNVFFEIGYYPTASTPSEYTYDNLIYRSVLANYYPEFYSTSSHSKTSYYQTNNFNSTLSTESYDKGLLRLGNLYSTEKYFPTSTSSFIYTINIPKSLYNEKIQPSTFVMDVNGGWIYDDGEYNLRWSGSGFYTAYSGSSLIRLNSGTLPVNLRNLIVGGNSYPITSRDSNNIFHISSSLYLDSSSYTVSYYTSSIVSGSDLTMYTIQTDVTAANTTITSTSGVSGSSTLNFTPSTLWNFTSGPIPPPPANLSGSFGGGPPYTTVLTVTPATGYFQFGTSSLSYAYIASATGSLDMPPYTGSFGLAPGYTLLVLPPSGSTFILTKTSQSYQPSTVVTQSSVIFNANIIDSSGSINVGGTNYPIINRLSAISVEIATPLLYTASTGFTLEYTSSEGFTSSSISAGGTSIISNPYMSSSIGTILSQSSYVGNIFYEQGVGVLTKIPISLYP